MASKRRFTDQQEKAITAAYMSGQTSEGLAALHNTSAAMICKIVRRQGGTVRGAYPTWEDTRLKLISRFGEEIIQTICNHHRDGKSPQWIANLLGISRNCILTVLKNEKVEMRSFQQAHHVRGLQDLPPETEQMILTMNTAGEPVSDIQRATGQTWAIVTKVLREHDREWRSSKSTWYTVNHRFFSEINSEETSYWLGFFCADGSITRHKHHAARINLRLQARDIKHVEAFKKAVGSTHPVVVRDMKGSDGKWRPAACLSFASEEMAADLARLGVTPNKVKRVAPPIVSPDLLRHMWRGWVDGDGSLCLSKASHVVLIGTLAVTKAFGEYIHSHVAQSGAAPYKNKAKNCCQISFGGNQLAAIIACHLYSDCTIALSRKQEKARLMMDRAVNVGSKHDWSDMTQEKLDELFQQHGSWNKVSKILGISNSHLFWLRNKVASGSPFRKVFRQIDPSSE